MIDQALMNNEAARSQTGEILDQSTTSPLPPDTTTTTTDTSNTTNTTETVGGQTALTKPAEVTPPAPQAAPENYTDFKAPENYTIDPKTIEAATPIFKELGLSQDQAQKLVDFHTGQMLAAAKGPQDAYAATRTEWQTKTQSDPDMKAHGFDKVKTDIGRALNAIGDALLVSEFKQAMDITGAGDHPAFVKAMWKLSQFVAEGKHVAGAGPSSAGQKAPGAGPVSIANALYPNLK